MKILIVEDEALVAQRIKRFTEQIMGNKISAICVKNTLEGAGLFISENPIDLLLLDLNLSGKNGFEILREVTAESFHTIIISANVDKALEAFEYGVLDFVGKPFTIERLQKAFNRFFNVDKLSAFPTKYLSVKKGDKLLLIDIAKIEYIRGSGVYTEINTTDGDSFLHNKSLNNLDAILPSNFVRIHKSYLANIDYAEYIKNHGAGKYVLILQNNIQTPVSRSKYKELKSLLG